MNCMIVLKLGLVLQGTEIKSIRRGKVQLKDSYISFQKGEAFIKGMHISPYEFGNRFNHDETRDRKLLMHKQEIQKLEQSARIKGYTVVPVRIYLYKGLAKLEIALAKGKIFMISVNLKRRRMRKERFKRP